MATSDDLGTETAQDIPTHTELVVFILARCPHCASFMRTLLPLKQELGPALELGIGYVGSVTEDGRADFAHGDAEVAAAEIQICAGLESGEEEWIAFLACIYEGDHWRELPKGWTRCATQAGLDIEAVATCVDDGEGREALGQAIEAAAESGIIAAPTAILGGQLYLGGRSREALLSHLCYLAGAAETRPPLCARVEPPPRVGAILISDRRCDDPNLCDVSREVSYLSVLIATLEIEEVDFDNDRGRDLYAAVIDAGGPRYLPLLVFDSGLNGHPSALERMADYLVAFDDGYLMPLGEGWDPVAEICNNGTDDDDDKAVDCADSDCSKTLPCRAEKMARIDLFMMSQCPFATDLVPALDRFLDHFGRDPSKVHLELQFIGRETDGRLESMHGQAEVEEDLRMACAQKLYRPKYQFMKYVSCRARNAESSDWAGCVPRGASAERIRKCAEGDVGRELLRASFERAAAIGARGSPTWIVNNRYELEARTTAELVQAFCAHNELTACSKEVAPELEAEGGSLDKCE